MIPRFGIAPEPARRYRRRPGAYAILLREGRVLLTHQAEPEPEFQLPGGGIDPGEGPIAALHREVMEETGWTISTPRRIGAYRRFCYMPEYDLHAEKLCSVWLARPVMRLAPPLEPGHEAHWVPLDRASALLPDPGSRAALGLVLARADRSYRNCR
ncbi:NUDIX domain-containing protein [Paracoccus methylarcula]|uniref:NUDIX domain-containing protein n=1 Tax=Paracoccus methylarcula TaxID=72022 RepID=A0A3R7LQS6_9RHOB|nr:NUDIX hydrolase [Paracoccus methylarcula]RNF35625.1 NUDIX domain-containing protein [Paracoccus methylarcula]